MSPFKKSFIPEEAQSKLVYCFILLFSFIWLVLISLAPLLTGLEGHYEKTGSLIYFFFSKTCHQEDARSFHLFGEKMAVCSRCLGIYAGFFIGTCLYPWKFKLNNIIPPSVYFLIIAIVLLIIDVILDQFNLLKNTFASRSITGFIAGVILPFFIIPGFVRFYYEVESFLRNKVST